MNTIFRSARAHLVRPLAFVSIAAVLAFASGCGPTTANNGGSDVPDGQAGDKDSGEGTGAATASGPEAPEFNLPTLDGDNIALSDYRGKKVVIIDFWSTTCDPCLAEMPELVKLYEEKKGSGLEVLAISTDGPETQAQVSATVSKLDMSFPILLDSETEVMDRYNPKGELPMTIVVNKQGVIVLKRTSYQPGDEKSWNSLVAAVDNALAE